MAFHGLLVSSGFSSSVIREKVAQIAQERAYKKAHIITTARPEKRKGTVEQSNKETTRRNGYDCIIH